MVVYNADHVKRAMRRLHPDAPRWQRFASAFDATQHVTGPIVVTTANDRATAERHVRAYHQIKGAAGGEIWMVAGHYTVRLRLIDAEWRIDGITLTVFYQEGNLEIPNIARSRASSSPPR